MAARSAGVLLHRPGASGPEVLLVHPGGPFWARKDAGAWSIPKGELADDEDPRAAAVREFTEETGHPVDPADLRELGTIRQKGGKQVTAYACAGDLDPLTIVSNTVELEWPPRSGRRQVFPEVDRAAWFDPAAARVAILAGQAELLDRLDALLAAGTDPTRP